MASIDNIATDHLVFLRNTRENMMSKEIILCLNASFCWTACTLVENSTNHLFSFRRWFFIEHMNPLSKSSDMISLLRCESFPPECFASTTSKSLKSHKPLDRFSSQISVVVAERNSVVNYVISRIFSANKNIDRVTRFSLVSSSQTYPIRLGLRQTYQQPTAQCIFAHE